MSTVFSGVLKNITNAGAGGGSTGNGRLIKDGSGAITFTGQNDINGTVTVSNGIINISPGASLCGPICDIYCQFGNVLDSNGCPTCSCNPPPTVCPAVKCKACTYGYLLDANGCQTCTCAPQPSLPCNQLLDPTSCMANSACNWLEPGCGTPALAATGCYKRADIDCTSNDNCSDGKICVQRIVDPCVFMDCAACAAPINICQ